MSTSPHSQIHHCSDCTPRCSLPSLVQFPDGTASRPAWGWLSLLPSPHGCLQSFTSLYLMETQGPGQISSLATFITPFTSRSWGTLLFSSFFGLSRLLLFWFLRVFLPSLHSYDVPWVFKVLISLNSLGLQGFISTLVFT